MSCTPSTKGRDMTTKKLFENVKYKPDIDWEAREPVEKMEQGWLVMNSAVINWNTSTYDDDNERPFSLEKQI